MELTTTPSQAQPTKHNSVKQLLIDIAPSSMVRLNEGIESMGIKCSLPNPLNLTRIGGIVQRANSLNQNGRVYPRELLEEAIEKYRATNINTRTAWGEIEHPERSTVLLPNICVNMIDVYWQGDDLIGILEVLKTPQGAIIQGLLDSGCPLGISSRADGSVYTDSDGTMIVDQLDIKAFDMVSSPSTHGAFLSKLHENYANSHKNIESTKYQNMHRLITDIFSNR